MPIDVQCPQCGRAYRVGDDKAGRRFQCKGCQSVVTVPAGDEFGQDDLFAGFDDAGGAFAGSPAASTGRSKSGGTAKGKKKSGSKKKGNASGNTAVLGVAIGGVVIVVLAVTLLLVLNRGGGGNQPEPAGGDPAQNLAQSDPAASSPQSLSEPGPAEATASTPPQMGGISATQPAGGPAGSATGSAAAVTAAREFTPAEMTRVINQLRNLGLGMHNYHDVFGSFPVTSQTPGALGADGRPHLSWRVHLLPFLGELELYNRFRLDEPWDSPHNSALLSEMPDIYRTPGEAAEATTTRFVVFGGPGAPFERNAPRIHDFIDGTSMTILVAHLSGGTPVPWTSPENAVFDRNNPLACIGSMPPQGLPVVLADGSAYLVNPQLDPQTFAHVIQHQDRQMIDYDLAFHSARSAVPDFTPPATPPTGPLPLAYMPEDCIGVIRISLRPILETDWVNELLPPDLMLGAPRFLNELEEVLVWIVPEETPFGTLPAQPQTQFALRFSRSVSPADVLEQMAAPEDQVQVYEHAPGVLVFCRPDRMPMMFAGAGASHPLAGSLRDDQLDADYYQVFRMQSDWYSVDWEGAEMFLIPAGDLGTGLMEIEEVQLAIRTQQSPLLKVWLTFPDEQAAANYKSAADLQLPFLLQAFGQDPEYGPLVSLLGNALRVEQTGRTTSLELAHSQELITALVTAISDAVESMSGFTTMEFDAGGDVTLQLFQILIASHNYHNVEGRFPVRAQNNWLDDDGKPLLSWRVHILPYLEEVDLYRQFRLDEPWDSPHNIQLLERMPAIYDVSPQPDRVDPPTTTRIVRYHGADGPFPNGVGSRMADFRDGLSNTIYCFVVGEDQAVPWTKPDDLPLDFSKPLADQLGNLEDGILWFGMADGAVRMMTLPLDAADDRELQHLLLHNDGQ